MVRALDLAENGLFTTRPNPAVGCVLVRDGRVIGEGWHERAGGPHAEAVALDAVDGDVAGATAFVTLEPCAHEGRTPSCANRLIDVGIAEVVVAVADPDRRNRGAGLARLREAGITVREGLLAERARALNEGFFQRTTHGVPFVRVKLAMSVDGRTALASGESQWVTGEAARADGHRWRARAGAIMTGIGTVIADDPRLTVRIPEPVQPPLLVVLDTRARTSPDARLFDRDGEVIIVVDEETAPDHPLADRATMLQVGGMPEERLQAVLTELGRREINELHVEAGPTLAGALLETGLVDELLLYVAPCVLGDQAQPLFKLPELQRMAERIELHYHEVMPIGEDLRLRLRPPA